MPFQKGNKLAHSRKREGGGRPSKVKQAIKQQAREIARAYIEKHLEPVLKAYLQLAGGRVVKHHNMEDGRVLWEENEVDAPTLRHWIDKCVAPAKTEVDVNVHGSVEVFTNVDPDGSSQKKN